MDLSDHQKISLVMFGQEYTRVHEFLDQYFPKFGPYHRIVLHHQLGINLVVQHFSDSARKVAEQHIIDDLGRVPEDWREFPWKLDNVDYWLSKKTALQPGELKKVFRELYPDLIH